MIDFQFPWILGFIPLIFGLAYIYYRKRKQPSVKFSSLSLVKGLPGGIRIFLNRHLFGLRFLAILFVVIALAGPRKVLERAQYTTQGIDIILAIDVSGSMAAEDFRLGHQRVNRLDVVKDVAKEFIGKRFNDRIGIVAFAGEAYTVCPLTLDQDWLLANLDRLDVGLMKDGTAVGSGIASSINRLRESPSQSRVIILLTDGVNNAGTISPQEAAAMAQALGIRVYAIGVGTKGLVPFPMTDARGRRVYRDVQIDFDEKVLRAIAQTTGAKYFQASDTAALRSIYNEIDQIEKVDIIQTGYRLYEPFFWIFLLSAMGILLIEIVLARTWLLRIP